MKEQELKETFVGYIDALESKNLYDSKINEYVYEWLTKNFKLFDTSISAGDQIGYLCIGPERGWTWHLSPDKKNIIISYSVIKNKFGDIDDEVQKIFTLEEFIKQFEEETIEEINPFKKYIDGKWHTFQGYEYGAVSVRFTNIYKDNDGNYRFDGDLINWATPDSPFEGDGIVIQSECEGLSFTQLPYIREELKTEEEVCHTIEYFYGELRQIQTNEEIREDIHNSMDASLYYELGMDNIEFEE